jgi:hypothetical protein
MLRVASPFFTAASFTASVGIDGFGGSAVF